MAECVVISLVQLFLIEREGCNNYFSEIAAVK